MAYTGIDYSSFLSQSGERRVPHRLKNKEILGVGDDVIRLSAGMPNSKNFPMDTISLHLKDGSQIELDGPTTTIGQQYSPPEGLPEYEKLIHDLVYKLHTPPCWGKTPQDGGTAVFAASGASDIISQVADVLLDEGDTVLIEEFTYPGIVNTMRTGGCNIIPVPMDENGIIPKELRQIMSRWDPGVTQDAISKPKLLYTIPCGQNPTGSNLSLERKSEIYKIAQEYNFLIYEDDAYYLLTYEKQLSRSFLSLDSDGRVIRGDTFSKSLGPGFRAGYISGPEPLIRKMGYRQAVSSNGPPILCQVMIISLFKEWGIDGFLKHCESVAELYRQQMKSMIDSSNRWLNGLVEFKEPTGGMFIWMKVKGCDDTKTKIFKEALKNGVIVTPGEFFRSGESTHSSFLRLAFSKNSPEAIDKAIQRLAVTLRNTLDSGRSDTSN